MKSYISASQPRLKALQHKGKTRQLNALLLLIVASLFTFASAALGIVLPEIVSTEKSQIYLWVITAGSALLAWLILLYREKVIDRGVVIDLMVDQLGTTSNVSQLWSNKPVKAFAAIHRPFTIGTRNRANKIGTIDISKQVSDAVRELEIVVSAHHQSPISLIPGGSSMPALLGMGTLSYLQSTVSLVERLDSVVKKEHKGSETQIKESLYLEIPVTDINARISPTKGVQQQPSSPLQVGFVKGGSINILDDWWGEPRSACDKKRQVVRLAYGAVKNSKLPEWKPFAGTRLEHHFSPMIWAGAIDENNHCFKSSDIVTTNDKSHRHDAQISPIDVAHHLARVILWTLWRYPQADIHLTLRVPRIVAFTAGLFLSQHADWAPQHTTNQSKPVFIADIAERLNIWGSLRASEHQGASTTLALFKIFPSHQER